MQTKDEIVAELRTVQNHLAETISTMDSDVFLNATFENWSPADHVKHLLLSVKPLAKAMLMSPEQMSGMFGETDRASMTFMQLVDVYKDRIKGGLRAEDFSGVTPTGYRLPEGVTDVKAYLTEQWNSANSRLIDSLANWTEEALDHQVLPHPAIGIITLREMLFFTVYHNGLHGQQIEAFVERTV
jgi:hypothetical protein